MIGARILDGDMVYIRKQPEVENGEIAAVIIDAEEATLKRFYRLNGTVILRAENPNCSDRTFSKKDMKQVAILGKAIFFKSEVK
jgi:repressor LexA